MKTLQCREHGGTFSVVPRRGRPPVRCSDDNPCSRAGTEKTAKAVERMANGIPRKLQRDPDLDKFDSMNAAELRVYARQNGASTITKLTNAGQLRRALRTWEAQKTPEATAETPEVEAPSNPSLEPAMAAKAKLEALGWICKGKAHSDTTAILTCSRGDELLIVQWEAGNCVSQDYQLWDVDTPKNNDKPTSRLTFDPDECTDSELVRALSGMKITWWNKLGQSEESGIVSPQKIEIVHSYDGIGDETPGDRIVKFIDHGGSGFRNFRVAALLKVG
jgi:hypothetical protein